MKKKIRKKFQDLEDFLTHINRQTIRAPRVPRKIHGNKTSKRQSNRNISAIKETTTAYPGFDCRFNINSRPPSIIASKCIVPGSRQGFHCLSVDDCDCDCDCDCTDCTNCDCDCDCDCDCNCDCDCQCDCGEDCQCNCDCDCQCKCDCDCDCDCSDCTDCNCHCTGPDCDCSDCVNCDCDCDCNCDCNCDCDCHCKCGTDCECNCDCECQCKCDCDCDCDCSDCSDCRPWQPQRGFFSNIPSSKILEAIRQYINGSSIQSVINELGIHKKDFINLVNIYKVDGSVALDKQLNRTFKSNLKDSKKYLRKFNLKAILQVKKGATIEDVAEKYNLNKDDLINMIENYKKFGPDVCDYENYNMSKNNKLDSRELRNHKLKAVLSIVRGIKIEEVSKTFRIDKEELNDLLIRYKEAGPDGIM